ncbi:MAG: hydroxysqualene dehydroxylase HpnE [Pseudomonadota bacterium]
MNPARKHLAVVGGGWAGLAAAVEASARGHQVTLFEMAPQLGGRARSVADADAMLDNGQHIMIGAYRETLRLMRLVGADPDQLLLRLPLTLRYPDGGGLQLPPGAPLLAFARGVLACRRWPLTARGELLMHAMGWLARSFSCPADFTVDRLTRALPIAVREDLIEPLCVAALNTPASHASATVFLRVLKDGLFSGPGSADLLLPRAPLSRLLPEPAQQWLQRQGAQLRLGERAASLARGPGHWLLDGAPFDAVVLACSASEAARLAKPLAPSWARAAANLHYEPIITAYLRCEGARLERPMTALRAGPQAPAQFVFDLGALGLQPGRFAFVVSGAAEWVSRGLDACGEAVCRQAQDAFPSGTWPGAPRLLRVLAEKRATFACTPQLARPAALVAEGLVAAGDYIEGPYPATIEGAVRSGVAAAHALAR